MPKFNQLTRLVILRSGSDWGNIQARLSAWLAAILLAAGGQASAAGAGFATRDLNPMLQPIYLPSRILSSATTGWRVEHGLFITNTLQQQSRAGESLVIDVENYRYELDFGYRREQWVAQVNIPLLANNSGELDGLIEDWHSFFGFPQGKRDQFPRDRLQIEYLRNGIVEYSQTQSSNGLGDVALALGYETPGGVGYFAGIELPTGSASDYSGNEAVDIALWLAGEYALDPELNAYGMIGISFPGDDGNLKGLLVDQIWLAQLGFDYRFSNDLIVTGQLDLHGKTLDDSELKAFGNSLQIQLGLGFPNLIGQHRLDLFFSEDILVGSAPDISFGLRLARDF